MSEQKKISELDQMSKAEAAEGYIPASVGGKTVRLPVAEFADGEAGGSENVVDWDTESLYEAIKAIKERGGSPVLKIVEKNSTNYAHFLGEGSGNFSFFRSTDTSLVRYNVSASEKYTTSGIYTGDTKVRYNTPSGYLEDLIKAADDSVTIEVVDGKLLVKANGSASVPTGTPALSTMGMNEINAQTNNYGSWNGDAPEWGVESGCNSICYQLKRMSMGNGAVNTCHVYISQPGAQSRFKVGIFDTAGNELGATDVVDVFNTNKPAMLEIPMTETAEGTLTLNSGEMYVIKVVAIGVGFGGSEHSNSNWNFDNNSHFNISTTMAGFRWASNDDGQGVGNNNIPFVAFSYKENG